MPGAARLNDTGSGHDCFPETPITEGSSDVIINGQPAARQGDTVLLHGCPCPNAPHGVHSRKIAEGSSTVIINGKPAARIGDGINCGGVIISGSGNVIIGDTPYKSPVHECAQQAALTGAPLLALSPMLAAPPVYAKSCLLDTGCTQAGTEEEPVENFGEMVLFAQPEQDDCCGYGHYATDNSHQVEQHAQAAKKKKPEPATTETKSSRVPQEEPWHKTLFDLWVGADTKAVSPLPASQKLTEPVIEKPAPIPAATGAGVLASGRTVGAMTQVWGEWSLGGYLSAARAVPYIGALASALYIPKAGEGSDKVPGRDEYWLEDVLRRKGWAGEKATTRVRFFWRPDINGNMQVYGVHTGEGTPYEGVRVANMVWDAKIQGYTFTPAPGIDGPTITWTPEKPEGAEPVTHTGSPVKPINQPTILIYPIPEDETETTTPPFPVPDEHDFNDWILVFPIDSGVKPIYVYLQSARDKPGVVTGKGEVLSGEGKWLEAASSGVGAPIPAQVADKLRGREFRDFDHFREAFWLAVAECPELMRDFKPSNQTLIIMGLAAYPIPSEQVGGRTTFELHHVEQIQHGGEVFNVDNIRVTTPRLHIGIHKNANKQ